LERTDLLIQRCYCLLKLVPYNQLQVPHLWGTGEEIDTLHKLTHGVVDCGHERRHQRRQGVCPTIGTLPAEVRNNKAR
jgi:hypothetical protein